MSMVAIIRQSSFLKEYSLLIHTKKGIAAQLVTAIQAWGRVKGCNELASDTDIDNIASQKMHQSLGFQETERVVFFKKQISDLR
ncbi:GNAT family N-acetyltransferase [Yersinia intermedia]